MFPVLLRRWYCYSITVHKVERNHAEIGIQACRPRCRRFVGGVPAAGIGPVVRRRGESSADGAMDVGGRARTEGVLRCSGTIYLDI